MGQHLRIESKNLCCSIHLPSVRGCDLPRGRLVFTLGHAACLLTQSVHRNAATEHRSRKIRASATPPGSPIHALSKPLGLPRKTDCPSHPASSRRRGRSAPRGQAESLVLPLSPHYEKEPVQSAPSLRLQTEPKLRDVQELPSDDR